MSETFKPGQTVWLHGGDKCEVIACDGDQVWVRQSNGERVVTWPNRFVATDPKAEPVPQKCPFCGGPASLHGSHSKTDWFYVSCDCRKPDSCTCGPSKPTRLEAIQAWNSIRIATALDMQKEFLAKEAAAHAERLFPPADSDPLTKEWLRKVGLHHLTDGLPTFGSNGVLFVTENGSVGFFRSESRSVSCNHGRTIKTIGDARTLCRLLGVPLKE